MWDNYWLVANMYKNLEWSTSDAGAKDDGCVGGAYGPHYCYMCVALSMKEEPIGKCVGEIDGGSRSVAQH